MLRSLPRRLAALSLFVLPWISACGSDESGSGNAPAEAVVFVNPDYVETGPGTRGAHFLASVEATGVAVDSFTDGSDEGFTAALNARTHLLLPHAGQLASDMSGGTANAISEWVESGGTLIVAG
ncbi:MAG: DUF4350 domain-containing protein, partial [Actinomycetota bacterium]|nr:DUF4350 domain-containing protein [Actinomycetota bacterium]